MPRLRKQKARNWLIGRRIMFYVVFENTSLGVVLQPAVRPRFRQWLLTVYFV